MRVIMSCILSSKVPAALRPHRCPTHRHGVFHGSALAVLLLGAVLSTGCVSPGRAVGPLKVEGVLLSATGDPMPGVDVEVLLPQAYGTRSKELRAGEAMDFGMPRRELRLKTDGQGRFEGDLGEQTYAVDLWVFPPKGTVPPAPPSPAFLVRLPGLSDENYYACTDKGACLVIRANGERIPMERSFLVRGDARTETFASANSASGTLARLELVVNADGGRLIGMNRPGGAAD